MRSERTGGIADGGLNGEATTNHPQIAQIDADNAGETANDMLTQRRKAATTDHPQIAQIDAEGGTG